MREFLVLYKGGTEIVELSDSEKANRETFASKIDEGLNHYNGYRCLNGDILAWSLIEE